MLAGGWAREASAQEPSAPAESASAADPCPAHAAFAEATLTETTPTSEPASSSGTEIALKASITPETVPSRPRNGAPETMEARKIMLDS